MLAELTFGQELAKEVVGAAATAGLVTIGGAIVVQAWSGARDRRNHRFELRNDLLRRSTATAQRFYATCNDEQRRRGHDGSTSSVDLTNLRERYLDFAVEGPIIEFELGARFGFEDGLMDDPRPAHAPPRERFHQIRDLLTVFYYHLAGGVPPTIVEANSYGKGGRFHSGLEATALAKGGDELVDVIRSVYDEALRDLVAGILAHEMSLGERERWRLRGRERATRP